MAKKSGMVALRRSFFPLVLILCAAGFAGFLKHVSWEQAFLRGADRLAALSAALIVMAAALALGLRALGLMRLLPIGLLERLVLGSALGLGLLAFVTLGLGLSGQLRADVLWVVTVVCIAQGYRLLRGLLFEGYATLRLSSQKRSWGTILWAIIMAFFLMYLVRAYVPPFLYDVQEYHLAVPAIFRDAGSMSFVEGNVYANMPQNVETIYLLCMCLAPTSAIGVAAGNIIGVFLALLTAVALRQTGRRFFGEEAGDIAAAVYFVWPGISLYSGTGYITLPLIFYFAAAMLVFTRYIDRPGELSRRRWLVLAAMVTGVAMGCKYSAVLLLFVPLLAIVLVCALTSRRSALLADPVCFVLVALLAFSPWMVKSAAFTGNPVYPLLHSVFEGSHWSDEQAAKWMQAHSPNPEERYSPEAFGRRAWEFLRGASGEAKASLLMFTFIPAVLLFKARAWRVSLFLLCFVILGYVLWFLFTHRIDRFLYVLLPALAVLSGAGCAALVYRARAVGWCLLILFLLFEPNRFRTYVDIYYGMDVALRIQTTSEEEFFSDRDRTDFSHGYDAMRFIGDLPGEVRVMFLGEARTYYCRRRFLSATVFDPHPLEQMASVSETSSDLYKEFRNSGVSHLLVHLGHLSRLQETYKFTYKGETKSGMLDGFDWQLFGQFAREHLRLVRTFVDPALASPGWAQFDWARYERFRAWSVAQNRRSGGWPEIILLYEVVGGVEE